MNNELQIRTLIENWAAAVRNNEMDGILAHHSADIMMFDVPPPFQSTGIDAYRKTWDIFFKYTKQGVFDIQSLEIFAGDDVAFCVATMKCEDGSGGKDYEPLDFRLTVGLKKLNNEWMI